ncbi:MAG TPA: PIN domain-containing protein [Thermoleophilaceae bacterium]
MRLVDTSFWVALQFRRDGNHDEARAIWEAGPGALLTTNHVLGETWTFLRRRVGHAAAVEFLDRSSRSRTLTVRQVGERAEREAWRWLRRHDEREYSFVDATSFAVMRSLRMREALAFDGDFAAAGFVEVRA